MMNNLRIVRTQNALREALQDVRRSGQKIGFVPTMGALHKGHVSLLHEARRVSDFVVASIFVNPTQFAPGEDLDTYPRPEQDDLEALASAGCDLAYLPEVAQMYPDGSRTDVRVAGLSDLLDGVYRPHFFYGVTTVVARLFVHVGPDLAVFGEKDFQQLQIIRRMVLDLGFPVEIIGAPTIRETDGLASSSRNLYLTPSERAQAWQLSAALHRATRRLAVGQTVKVALDEAHALVSQSGFDKVDYISVVDPETLEDCADGVLDPGQEVRLLGAAWMGKTRLIDNLRATRTL